MNSADVSAGDQTLATQYNNLRTDVTDLGHVQLLAGAGGITQYDFVYVSGSNTILKGNANAALTAGIEGIAMETQSVGVATWVLIGNGVITNLAWSWTPKAQLYLSTTDGLLTEDVKTLIQTGKQIVRCARAITATSIIMRIEPQTSVGI